MSSSDLISSLVFCCWQKIITGQTLPLTQDNKISCFRVRSRLNKYCAEKSLWSEWSRPMCHPGNDVSIYEKNRKFFYLTYEYINLIFQWKISSPVRKTSFYYGKKMKTTLWMLYQSSVLSQSLSILKFLLEFPLNH